MCGAATDTAKINEGTMITWAERAEIRREYDTELKRLTLVYDAACEGRLTWGQYSRALVPVAEARMSVVRFAAAKAIEWVMGR